MLARGDIEISQQSPALHVGYASDYVNADVTHPGEIDNETSVAAAMPRSTVPAPADCNIVPVGASVGNRSDHVSGARASCYRPWVLIDHRVPKRAGVVVLGMHRQHQVTAE